MFIVWGFQVCLFLLGAGVSWRPRSRVCLIVEKHVSPQSCTAPSFTFVFFGTMSGPPNPPNYEYYGGYAQNYPRSLMDSNWSYQPTAPQVPYAPPQYPVMQQPHQAPRPPLVPPPGNIAPTNPRNVRPFRPRVVSHSSGVAKSWPSSNKGWLEKIDKDSSSTTIDFKQATEEGGARFSDRVQNRLDNASLVGGDILMEICKAATASEIGGTDVGLKGEVVKEGDEPSLLDQIKAIERLEEEMKKA